MSELDAIRKEARRDPAMKATVKKLRESVQRLAKLVEESEMWRLDGDRASFWEVMADIEKEAITANALRSLPSAPPKETTK